MAEFDSGYPEKTTLVDDDVVLLADSQDLTGGKKKIKSLKASTIKEYVGGGDISLKTDRISAESQQIPLNQDGDGFHFTTISPATPATINGTLAITENTLAENTATPEGYMPYFIADGEIFGFEMLEGTVFEAGFTGDFMNKLTFTRLTNNATYVEDPGLTTLSGFQNKNYGIQSVIAFPGIMMSFNTGENEVVNGTDAVSEESPIMTRVYDENNSADIMSMNNSRLGGLADPKNLDDAVPYSLVSSFAEEVSNLGSKPVIISSMANPPYNIVMVDIVDDFGEITAEVGQTVSFPLPANNSYSFQGTVESINGSNPGSKILHIAFIADNYDELPEDDAGKYVGWFINVNNQTYYLGNYSVIIATTYAPVWDGNGENIEGALAYVEQLDPLTQKSFVENFVRQMGTRVMMQFPKPTFTDRIEILLNRSLAAVIPDDLLIYNKTTGVKETAQGVTGFGTSWTVILEDTATDKVVEYIVPGFNPDA